MHPAPSVIFFTALSGMGFGLLAWLGIGQPETSGLEAFAFFFAGYALAVGGLLASVLHLGNPKNAPKAFSQWRSSWLSREGVLAVAALVILAPYALGLIFLGKYWPMLGGLGALAAVLTVFATSMIYAQLRAVPRWNSPLTPVLFVLYSLGGGALLAGQAGWALGLLVLAGAAQVLAWVHGDGRFRDAGSTPESATGLGRIGKVRLLEPPHSQPNYLSREMVHVIGRRHAQVLRILGLGLAVGLPVLVLLVADFGMAAWFLALASHLLGVLAIRWLFFAEAEHVMKLYYGG